MGKKEINRNNCSLWSLFGFRSIFSSILGRFHLSKSNVAAFTLIELLVVIAIIGVLAGSLVFTLNPGAQFAKTRDAQRKNDLERVKVALDTYYGDYNVYPGVGEISGLVSGKYLQAIPKDPSSGADYAYEPEPRDAAGGPCASDCSSYRLYAKLERCFDAQGVIGVDCQRTDKEYSVNSSNLSAPELLPPPPPPEPSPVDPVPEEPPPFYEPDPGFWFW